MEGETREIYKNTDKDIKHSENTEAGTKDFLVDYESTRKDFCFWTEYTQHDTTMHMLNCLYNRFAGFREEFFHPRTRSQKKIFFCFCIWIFYKVKVNIVIAYLSYFLEGEKTNFKDKKNI